MSSSFYVLLYIGLWAISFCVFNWRKHKMSTNLGKWLILLWSASACVSLWMLHTNLYYQSFLYKYDIVSFVPLFYLWITIILYAMPLFVFKVSATSTMSLCSNSGKSIKLLVIKIISISFIILAIIYLYSFVTLPNKTNFYSLDAGTMRKREVMVEVLDTLFKSKIFTVANKLFRFLSDSMICLSFCLFVQKRTKQALILFFAATVPIVYSSIVTGDRQRLICLIMTLFITFLIFRKFFSIEFVKKCQRIFLICVALMSIPVFLISVLRFGDYTEILVYEMLRYFGESCLNFASWLFPHLQGQDNGRKILSTIFKELPFYNPPVVTLGPFFYTFVGGIIQAVGRFWTFVIGLLFCVSALLTQQNPERLSFGKAVLIQTIAIMCFEGLFGFIHHLYMGAFFIGFFWIAFLDTNWFILLQNGLKKIHDSVITR